MEYLQWIKSLCLWTTLCLLWCGFFEWIRACSQLTVGLFLWMGSICSEWMSCCAVQRVNSFYLPHRSYQNRGKYPYRIEGLNAEKYLMGEVFRGHKRKRVVYPVFGVFRSIQKDVPKCVLKKEKLCFYRVQDIHRGWELAFSLSRISELLQGYSIHIIRQMPVEA